MRHKLSNLTIRKKKKSFDLESLNKHFPLHSYASNMVTAAYMYPLFELFMEKIIVLVTIGNPGWLYNRTYV
jgi:hypothetical protein